MSQNELGARALSDADRATRNFTGIRICPEPNCGTRLSIYNKGKFCAEHQPMAVPRTRGRKIA